MMHTLRLTTSIKNWLIISWWQAWWESTCNVGDLGLIPGQEDPLEKGMATHSSILARRIPRTEEPGRLQSTAFKESDKTERFSLSRNQDAIYTFYFSLYPSNKVARNIYIFWGKAKHNLPCWKNIYIKVYIDFIAIPANQLFGDYWLIFRRVWNKTKILSTYKILNSSEETIVLYVKENWFHSNLDNDVLING